jgi:protein-tyrosine phosphatase
MPHGWRARALRQRSPQLAGVPPLSWLGQERLAIGAMPPPGSVPGLASHGVTHVVNCRTHGQVWWRGDLAAERAVFGAARVAHAPMLDLGWRQRPRLWAPAAGFAARVLADQPQARVLIHCSAGRRRSAMLAYAVLRLRGHAAAAAAALVLEYRPGAQLVPAYVHSVERWLAREHPAPS